MIGWSFYAHHVNGWATSANGWSFYARHVSDFGFKGFLGVVLLASCSVYFGYKECVPVVGLHFPSEYITYSVERLVLHGASECHVWWQFTISMCPSSASLQ